MKRFIFIIGLLLPIGLAQAGLPIFSVLAGGRLISVAAPATPFVTSATSTTRGGNYEIGMEFTVGGSDLTVTALGREWLTGNSASHTVSIYSSITSGSPTLVCSASVSMATGTNLTWNYSSASATLTAGVTYALVSSESDASGDVFLEGGGAAVTTTAAATMIGYAYRTAGSTGAFTVGSSSGCYGVPNFKYQ